MDIKVRDSNGALLAEGDSVTLIKDLKLKGSSTVLKRGTVIRGIHLTDNADEIEGRTDKVKGLVLRTKEKPWAGRLCDLPVGLFVDRRVESFFSDFPKNICCHLTQIRSRTFASRPTEGRIRIVRDAGWDAVDAAAFCARRDCRAGSLNP